MKKSILILACAFLALSAFAAPSKKLLNLFTIQFPGATEVQWSESNDGYMAYYHMGSDVTVRVYYDKNEKFQSSMRSYAAQYLPAHLRLKVKKDFPGATIEGVNEFSTDNGTNYFMLLQDKKNITRVRYTADGEESEIVEHFKKAK
ncbi:MAG: hypothetical protein JWN76_3147 [Chitinophagaceae bacterium]|nr:hypothetical protein [Chitinophagaceae bacterium]